MYRPYYQCLIKEAEETTCIHGEAPTDALWGIKERRTTVGVQQAMGALCASLTLEEAAETFSRLLPLTNSYTRNQLHYCYERIDVLSSTMDERYLISFDLGALVLRSKRLVSHCF
jgi:hypothetical protein